jgi:hypothetical protein
MRRNALLLVSLFASIPAWAEVTFTRDVAPILQSKCQTCHRPNDIGPFELLTYDDAVMWAADIQRVVENKIMPPWKPVEGHGTFKNNFGLTESERVTLLNWIAAGTPQGDPADMPEPKVERSKWELGDPDMIVRMPEEYDIPRQKDVYRCFVIPSGLEQDQYLTAMQVAPGNRGMVHHTILYVDTQGKARKLDEADEGPGYSCFGGPGFDLGFNITSFLAGSGGMIGAWAPGLRAAHLPEGVGIHVPAGSDIVVEMHYFPNGRRGTDQSEVGLYWSKVPVNKRFRFLPLVDQDLNIPAGAKAHREGLDIVVPPFLDMTAITIGPHMHKIGTKIQVQVTDRRGDTQSLVRIDDWDFDWQNNYLFEKPIPLPSGTRARLTCEYNNSDENPNNPSNPVKDVRWGEGSEDEMCLAFVGITFDRENLAPQNRR